MNNSAPVNVKLKNPTEILPEWKDEAESWLTLNREIKGHPNFYPLTIKAAYVVGVIHSLCKSLAEINSFFNSCFCNSKGDVYSCSRLSRNLMPFLIRLPTIAIN